MARQGPTISAVIRGIVRSSPEPLSVGEVARELEQTAPGLSKDPAKSVKNFLANNRNSCVFKLPDGRLGWKPRLVSGATHRLIIDQEDLEERELLLDDAVRDLLYPAMFDQQKDEGSDRLIVALEGGPTLSGRVSHVSGGMWQLEAPEPLWEWLKARNAQPDDFVIFTCVDGEERRYTARLEPAAEYDEHAVAKRNEAVLEAAEYYVDSQRGGRYTAWELISHLNATGAFHHPVPPDPFVELWDDEDALDVDALDLLPIGPIDIPEGIDLKEAEQRLAAMLSSPTPPKLAPDDPLLPLLNQLAGQLGLGTLNLDPQGFMEVEDDEAAHPPDLNPAYYPTGRRRKAQPSAMGKAGPVKTYVLRVSHSNLPDSWRDIEIAEDQNFEDLHLIIQQAIGWDDDHLYSFFTGKKPFDRRTEISAPWAESKPHTHQVTLGSVGLKVKQRFFYLFDYGDQHVFDVMVMAVNPQAPKGSYPKIVGKAGRIPHQYSETWFE